jgi:hypothetical protein
MEIVACTIFRFFEYFSEKFRKIFENWRLAVDLFKTKR